MSDIIQKMKDDNAAAAKARDAYRANPSETTWEAYQDAVDALGATTGFARDHMVAVRTVDQMNDAHEDDFEPPTSDHSDYVRGLST
jgi:hypothetical protein